MGAIFRLSARQLAGGRRMVIVVLVASVPVVIAGIARLFASDEPTDEFVGGAFQGVLTALVLPIVTLAIATSAFGDEIEDRTLSYLTMKPISRAWIVLAKYAAVLVVTGPVIVASGVIVALLGGLDGIQPSLAVATALAAGVVGYAAAFTWAGLMTTRALPLGLIYVFLWEGAASSLLEGIRYGSFRAYTLSTMYELDRDTFASFSDDVIGLTPALVGTSAAVAVFLWLTVLRLRRMDVP
jgi:ABC-2 type transport system permease protein